MKITSENHIIITIVTEQGQTFQRVYNSMQPPEKALSWFRLHLIGAGETRFPQLITDKTTHMLLEAAYQRVSKSLSVSPTNEKANNEA